MGPERKWLIGAAAAGLTGLAVGINMGESIGFPRGHREGFAVGHDDGFYNGYTTAEAQLQRNLTKEYYDIHEGAQWLPNYIYPGTVTVERGAYIHTIPIVEEDKLRMSLRDPRQRFINWNNLIALNGVSVQQAQQITIENPHYNPTIAGYNGQEPMTVPRSWIPILGEIEVEGKTFTAGLMLEAERIYAPSPDPTIRFHLAPRVNFDQSLTPLSIISSDRDFTGPVQIGDYKQGVLATLPRD